MALSKKYQNIVNTFIEENLKDYSIKVEAIKMSYGAHLRVDFGFTTGHFEYYYKTQEWEGLDSMDRIEKCRQLVEKYDLSRAQLFEYNIRYQSLENFLELNEETNKRVKTMLEDLELMERYDHCRDTVSYWREKTAHIFEEGCKILNFRRWYITMNTPHNEV